MMKLLYRLTTVLLPALLWGALFTSCQDDQNRRSVSAQIRIGETGGEE